MAGVNKRKVREAEREARRARVSYLLLAGATQERIAEILGVTEKTIGSDVKLLVDEWRAQRKHDIDAAKVIDVERMDAMILKLWPDAMNKDRDAMRLVAALVNQKAQMMGYGKVPPQMLEINAPITIIEVVRPTEAAAALPAPVDIGADAYDIDAGPIEVEVRADA